jgi:hypothetical protein
MTKMMVKKKTKKKDLLKPLFWTAHTHTLSLHLHSCVLLYDFFAPLSVHDVVYKRRERTQINQNIYDCKILYLIEHLNKKQEQQEYFVKRGTQRGNEASNG